MRIIARCPGLGVVGLFPFLSNPQQCGRLVPIIASILLLMCLTILVVIEVRPSRNSPAISGRRYPVAISTDVSDPNLHYGVVIDCGSSGSRIYVYYWPRHTGNNKELLNINSLRDSQGNLVIKKVTPGLSDFASAPEDASDYIMSLLEFAEQHIPVEKHQETPLYIMATAGLRMLPENQQRALMDDIQRDVSFQTKLLFQNTHAEVISGKQEGVYTWISINYVLGKFNHLSDDDKNEPLTTVQYKSQDHRTHVRKRTVGIIEMGGGSAQIAFEISKPIKFEPQEESAKSLVADFNLGCTDSDADHNYRVYVSTFLGYGGNIARERYESMLITYKNSTYLAYNVNSTSTPVLLDPCLPRDMVQAVTHSGRQISLKGTGDFHECMELVRPLLNSTRLCVKEPCSMNGIFQPEIDFSSSEFYGFSEFYYSTEDVLRQAGRYNRDRFTAAAQDYCSTRWSTLQGWFMQKLYPLADEHRFKFQCFKSAWMSVVLHDGFKFPHSYKDLTTVLNLQGREVHWTLGALLYKTRYFPLSEIPQPAIHYARQSSIFSPFHDVSYVIFVCLAIVIAAILIYLRRLRIVKSSDLRKIPSMAYFMTEEGQMQDGVTISRQFYT